MNQKLKDLSSQNKDTDSLCTPIFFKLSNVNEKLQLSNLLNERPYINVYDELIGQLEELVKSQNPKIKFTKASLTECAIKHLGNTPPEEYGVWVYYPWSFKLVHILDKHEFISVRTNRNHYKITLEEEALLATKKIGVIGLSVGKAIALTIAMERICGELRIADFDVIELSNLNRIQTGVQNFGIKKTVVVAREIAEIDPYLKVTTFSDGLTEENVDDFLLKNGKLDVCIEVCDGLYTKILSRQKAKKYGIPVVMNSSDRGTTDIERYDTNPELPLLHGLIDHLDLNLVKAAKTNEEKVPYLLPMLGVETSSTRLKASMLEIGETITTWPQLASGVILGGGICTDVCRRILLNQLHDSGRYFVDVEELIADKKTDTKDELNTSGTINVVISQEEIVEIALGLVIESEENVIPTEAQIKSIVEAAIQAPSGGNAQSWKWHYSKGNLFLYHDLSRSNSLLDFDNLASYISFGAATENLFLKSHALGLNPKMIPFPLKSDNRVISHFIFKKETTPIIDYKHDYLVNEIGNRLTNRIISERQIINSDVLLELKKTASTIDGANLQIIESSDDIEKIAHIVSSIERLRMMHQRGHSDFVKEIRWTNEENERKRDGVDLNTVDITETERAGLTVSKNWEVVNTLKKWNLGAAYKKLTDKAILNSSAMGLITMPTYSPISYFNAGRALQRTWLAATKLNISLQPQSPSTFFFARLSKGNGIELDDLMKEELSKLRTDYEHVMNLNPNLTDVFLFRLFKGNQPEIKSIRRKIEDVLTINTGS